MERERFETVVAQAIAALPGQFRDAIKNIAIVIEGRPPRTRRGKQDESLLGLYEGVPLTERTHEYAGAVPDKITLFQKNLESMCATEDEMMEEIYRTFLHEIGHYFGLTEGQLEELGY